MAKRRLKCLFRHAQVQSDRPRQWATPYNGLCLPRASNLIKQKTVALLILNGFKRFFCRQHGTQQRNKHSKFQPFRPSGSKVMVISIFAKGVSILYASARCTYVPPPPGILGLPTVLEVNPTLGYLVREFKKLGYNFLTLVQSAKLRKVVKKR